MSQKQQLVTNLLGRRVAYKVAVLDLPTGATSALIRQQDEPIEAWVARRERDWPTQEGELVAMYLQDGAVWYTVLVGGFLLQVAGGQVRVLEEQASWSRDPKEVYQAIAEAIYNARIDTATTRGDHADAVLCHAVTYIASALQQDNPHFDRARFIEACETGAYRGMVKRATEPVFRCEFCKRPEDTCSTDPCSAVVEDRAR